MRCIAWLAVLQGTGPVTTVDWKPPDVPWPSIMGKGSSISPGVLFLQLAFLGHFSFFCFFFKTINLSMRLFLPNDQTSSKRGREGVIWAHPCYLTPAAWLVAKIFCTHAIQWLMSHEMITSSCANPARSLACFRFPSHSRDLPHHGISCSGQARVATWIGKEGFTTVIHTTLPAWRRLQLVLGSTEAMAVVGPQHCADPTGHARACPACAGFGGPFAVMVAASTSVV